MTTTAITTPPSSTITTTATTTSPITTTTPATTTSPLIILSTTATTQITLPLSTEFTATEATATTTHPLLSNSPDLTQLLSSDSTSGTPHPEETDKQRIERKIKMRQEKERKMLLKFQADMDAKDEEERKRKLKEQSDSDRQYMLKISENLAKETEREFLLKKQQEENDYNLSKLLEEVEKSELQKELDAAKKGNKSKKKGGVSSSVDKMWDEIDRKKYAVRMIGRSDPALITKVNLKKPKNKSQAQLVIHRGRETQAINLDQVRKLHREEWNEIRLAISHSSSSAKNEVLSEIDRLFKKMVDLQLLRPEDTVKHGEEIVQPPSPRYRTGTNSIYRIPNTEKLDLSIPVGVPRVEGTEVTEGEKGLVYRDFNGILRFQRESELEKIDHEQLVHLIRSVGMLPKGSIMKKAILEEGLARQLRFLPSTYKYELADELEIVKQEEVWRDST